MTRKDYIALARALAAHALSDALATNRRTHATYDSAGMAIVRATDVANAIANVLEADNPRFNRERFLKAAGATA